MAVIERKTRKRTVYWLCFYIPDPAGGTKLKQVWERVGTDKRAADALDRQRRKEVAAGTYARGLRPTMPFGEWLAHWMPRRTGRNAEDDEKVIRRYLLERAWLARLPCEEFRPRHSVQLVEELKVTPKADGSGKPLGEKYVSNIYGLYTTACRHARIAELMPVDPCVLPPGLLRRKAKKNRRGIYDESEVMKLASCSLDKAMVFAMLALLTGMREGEVAGRRWRNWDRHSMPLGCLTVDTQYDDQPLKTDEDEAGEHPRVVPVHPALARLLEWWWSSGFEFTFCRKPTLDDFILPRTKDGKEPHTRSTAYKLWRKACDLSGVTNRSLHNTRHTFITLARRGGGREDVVEKVTHNATGNIVDHYTHWDWAPLCEAVLCLHLDLASKLGDAAQNIDSNIDSTPFLAEESGGGAGNRRERRTRQLPAAHGSLSAEAVADDPPKPPRIPSTSAPYCAGQQQPTRVHIAPKLLRGGPPAWVHEATANLAMLLAGVS